MRYLRTWSRRLGLLAMGLVWLMAGAVLANVGPISGPITFGPFFSFTSGVVNLVTGTSGHVLALLDGANTWSGQQTFGAVLGKVTTQAGTTYTIAATDCGTTILFTSGSAITVTTLSTVSPGCAIGIEQAGAGQVTIAAGSGATQHSVNSFTKTQGQYAILGLFVDTNGGGSAANYIITGSGA